MNQGIPFMILKAYAHAAPQGQLRIWVGAFGLDNTQPLPAPSFTIDGQAAQAMQTGPQASALQAIRDGYGDNYQGLFTFQIANTGREHRVVVQVGQTSVTLATRSLPQALPGTMDGSFHVLLSSCYFQPNDNGGLLGTVASQLRRQPDLTILAGDQVYMDLPLFENVPRHDPDMSQVLGDKYRKNWTSGSYGIPGLEPLMARAPIVCLPDDHEFWNNYPFRQKQLPDTWEDEVRNRWAAAAKALYHDYQIGGPPTPTPRAAVRLDVDPLKMLFVDMRCERDWDFQHMMSGDGRQAVTQWVQDLLYAHAQQRPAVGLIGSGQALLIDPPVKESKKRDVDAEMGNYPEEFDWLMGQICRLTDAGIPVVYITGDVHWSRVAAMRDVTQQGRTMLYEVIASPSRLIAVPLADSAKNLSGAIKGLFGKRDPWPRHPDAEDPPALFGAARRFTPNTDVNAKRRGDQIAVLSFTGGANVQMRITYYAITSDKELAKSETFGPYTLINL